MCVRRPSHFFFQCKKEFLTQPLLTRTKSRGRQDSKLEQILDQLSICSQRHWDAFEPSSLGSLGQSQANVLCRNIAASIHFKRSIAATTRFQRTLLPGYIIMFLGISPVCCMSTRKYQNCPKKVQSTNKYLEIIKRIKKYQLK